MYIVTHSPYVVRSIKVQIFLGKKTYILPSFFVIDFSVILFFLLVTHSAENFTNAVVNGNTYFEKAKDYVGTNCVAFHKRFWFCGVLISAPVSQLSDWDFILCCQCFVPMELQHRSLTNSVVSVSSVRWVFRVSRVISVKARVSR